MKKIILLLSILPLSTLQGAADGDERENMYQEIQRKARSFLAALDKAEADENDIEKNMKVVIGQSEKILEEQGTEKKPNSSINIGCTLVPGSVAIHQGGGNKGSTDDLIKMMHAVPEGTSLSLDCVSTCDPDHET